MDDIDIICVILVLLLFYLALYKRKKEGFQTKNKLVGQIQRPWSDHPVRFYR